MKNRNQSGFSLILVVSLGLISMLMALAVSASLVPIFQNMGAQGVASSTASAAELGMQYALAQLNVAASTGTLSNITSPMMVPSSLTNNTNVVATITQLDTTQYPNLASSPIFNASAYNTTSQFKATDYRKLTSVATSGINKSTINVIVGPYMMKSSSVGPNALFSNALFAANNLQLNGQVSVMTETSSPSVQTQASIGSNNQISLLGTQNTIDGNVNAYNASTTATSIVASPNSKINGNINYNGQISNLSDPGGDSPFTTDTPANVALNKAGIGPAPNVLADGIMGIPQIGAVTQGAATVLNQAPAQSITSNSPAIMTVGGSNTVNVAPSSSVSDLGAINLSGNQVMVLTPGNYTASSINISGNGQIQVNVPASSTTGVSISVQGNSSGTTPLSIGGQGIAMTGSAPLAASNFQVFYNGVNTIQMSMSSGFNSFYGLLYAPNADVSLDTGSIGKFHGAIAANNLNVSGKGSILYDPNSVKPSNGGAGGVASGPGYTTPGSATQQFNVLSWQEPTRAMAP